jgi:hypothetical protein
MSKAQVAFILGAGFSTYAGLPLVSDFTEQMLQPSSEEHPDNDVIIQYLRKFIHDAFDHSINAKAKYWPELEDVFTCIDLSANTGHNLGAEYNSATLRTVRRALIVRMTSMLWEKYERAREQRNVKWKQLERFIKLVDLDRTVFISMNWDTVLEAQLEKIDKLRPRFTYTSDAIAVNFPESGKRIELQDGSGRTVRLIKMHGSINWLYCDNCRHLFWVPSRQVTKIAGQALSRADWERIDRALGNTAAHRNEKTWGCCRCDARGLGGRIATFSYRKALDFPMFHKSWFEAERELRDAGAWVFIGYSLPAADYEFKYLLKRTQLCRKPPTYMLVSQDAGDSERTYRSYQRFFGRSIKRDENCFVNGITDEVIHRIEKLYAT